MNHAARHQHEEPPPNKWGGYVGIPLLIVATLILAPRIYHRWILPNDSWPSYTARVLATRVVTAGTSENPWGTSFLYRVDVDAAWTDNGIRREEWVPTTKLSRNRDSLAYWASRQGKICVVRQSPRNPSARIAFF
ncbi:MAG: hypothetical protein WBG54_20680 [Acidobacteriaceae bacterium]